jgi:hypothetical protein
MLPETGINVLKHSRYSSISHVAICFALQIICDSCGYLGCQACSSGRLKEGKVVKVVIFVVDYSVTVHIRMFLQPGAPLRDEVAWACQE